VLSWQDTLGSGRFATRQVIFSFLYILRGFSATCCLIIFGKMFLDRALQANGVARPESSKGVAGSARSSKTQGAPPNPIALAQLPRTVYIPPRDLPEMRLVTEDSSCPNGFGAAH
jgi:hypothetical protein